MKTITLYDLVALFGLHLDGEDIDPTFNLDTTSFNLIIIKSTNYDPFIKSYCHKKYDVTQTKHMAFILTWISKYISCNRSKKVIKAYLGITMVIITGANVSLGSFILNYIFKGMYDLTFMENGKLNGIAR